MKKFDKKAFFYSLLMASFLLIICQFFNHFYMQNFKELHTQKLVNKIENFVLNIQKKANTVEDFNTIINDSLESFIYQIAIFSKEKSYFNSFKKDIALHGKVKKITTNNGLLCYQDTIKIDNHILNIKIATKLNDDIIKKRYTALIIASLIIFLGAFFVLYIFILNLLDRLNKNVDIFFKDALHELRTPLGVIQINLEILENKEPSILIDRSLAALKNLTQIYESIEYIIKHNRVEYKKQTINLGEFLQKRIEFLQIVANTKEVLIKTKIDPNVSVFMNTTKLERLIDNNITNAIKYSTKKSTIFIGLKKHAKKGVVMFFSNQASTSIKQNKIFDRYYRGDNFKGGFGIGLSIVKQICTENKITILIRQKKSLKCFFIYFFNNPHKGDIA